MVNKTFKEISKEAKTIKVVKKMGTSLGIIFTIDDLERFGLSYGDKIDLDDARIIKSNN